MVMKKSHSELNFEHAGRAVKCQFLEIARDYETVVIFVEIPEAEHAGFSVKKGDKIVAKGEIARAIREARIEGIEMAVPPPADSNALLMVRVTIPFESIKEKLMRALFREMKSKGLL